MNKNFCLSILALSPKYQELTRAFLQTLRQYSPEVAVVIGTDNPDAFKGDRNARPFLLKKQGILHCYHDKRFAIEKALADFPVVIQMDADTRITGPLPESIDAMPGLGAIHSENLVEHVEQYNPERLPTLDKLARKLDLPLAEVTYLGESLFSVSGESQQTLEFIREWDRIARYLQLWGIHAGQGIAMGIAAYKVGLEVNRPAWLKEIDRARYHFDASRDRSAPTSWQKWQRRADYHLRLNQARVAALKEFDFFYL